MVSNRQSPCRAAPGLKSHTTRAKVGCVKGHFEKQVPSPAMLSVTERRSCAITRGPEHISCHTRARPCTALGAAGLRQGMQPVGCARPAGLHLHTVLCIQPTPRTGFAITAPTVSAEPFVSLSDEEHAAAQHCSSPGD